MPKNTPKQLYQLPQYLLKMAKAIWHGFVGFWQGRWWHKLIVIIIGLIIIVFGTMYGVARWYIHSQAGKPYTMGVTFIPSYAEYLGVQPKTTLDQLLHIGVKNYRLVSYWDEIEPAPGQYDFSQLDWQFNKIQQAGGTVTLAIGLRQPRWPECHAPTWVDIQKPSNKWQPQLNKFIQKVVNRYKNSPVLVSYQLENEYFNHFGECYNFDRDRLASELKLVKQTDPGHPIILSRSNNYVGLMLRQPLPDKIGISIYRKVWDGQVTHRYFQYPYPAWYYAFLAGGEQIFTGKPSIIHEMQAEPWPPEGKGITQISLTEQNKSFNAADFKKRFDFARATGIHTVYFWGAEYWYYRMVKLHDPSVWNVARQEFSPSGQN